MHYRSSRAATPFVLFFSFAVSVTIVITQSFFQCLVTHRNGKNCTCEASMVLHGVGQYVWHCIDIVFGRARFAVLYIIILLLRYSFVFVLPIIIQVSKKYLH